MRISGKTKDTRRGLLSVAVIVFSLMGLSHANAANYYFSSTRGDDNSSGTQPNQPWRSVTKLQNTLNTIQPGDVIYLEKGSVWYQTSLSIQNKAANASHPIRIKAYGQGAMPILSGEKILTNPSKSGNVYTFNDTDIPVVYVTDNSRGRRFLGSVAIDGKLYNPARHPNGDEYYLSTSTGSTYLTDDLSWDINQWQGGFIGLKNVNWQWSTVRILSNTSNQLTTTPHITTGGGIGTPGGQKYYYFLNAERAMDLPGEWVYRDGQLKVYWEGTLGQVRVSVMDRILDINQSDYIWVDSVEFRGANFYGVKINRGDYNKFNHCKFSGIGEYAFYVYGTWTAPGPGIYGESENDEISNSEFVDVRLSSIFYRYCRGGIVRNNYIHRNALTEAYHNMYEDSESNPNHAYAISVFNNLNLNPVVEYNFIDSTGAGIITHYNPYEINIRYNFIRNYGMTERGDLGGFYLVSDTYTSANKNFKRNFVMDVHAPKGTLYTPYSDSYTHGLYFDQDSYQVHGDSNTVENCDIAIYTNGGKYRSFRWNNVLNPVIHGLHPAHKAVIANSYTMPLVNGTNAESDVFTYNTVVYNDQGGVGYRFSRLSNYGCALPIRGQIDYNSYFDPYGTSPTIAQIYELYSSQYQFNISQWQAWSTSCEGVTNNPGVHSTYNNQHYSDIKLFKNWSAQSKTIPLSGTYVDAQGNTVTGTVTIPPFYSKPLFLVSGDGSQDNDLYIDSTLVPALKAIGGGSAAEPVNVAPNIDPAEFRVVQMDVQPLDIGDVTFYDLNSEQNLTLSIVSGNDAGLFQITQAGRLQFTTSSVSFTGNPAYTLTVKVQDNGSPALSDQASIVVSLVATQTFDENSAPNIDPAEFRVVQMDVQPLDIGDITFYDMNSGQNLTLSIISGNDAGLFQITQAGRLRFTSSSVSFTGNPAYTLTVQVQDNGTPALSDQASVVVSLVATQTFDENSAPSIEAQNFEVNEVSPLPLLIGNVAATDADEGQNLSFSILSGNEDRISGGGDLYFTTDAVVFSGNPNYHLMVQVSDDGSPVLTEQAAVQISLLAEAVDETGNTQPVINPQSFNTSVDAELYVPFGTVEASDADLGQNLTYSIVSGNLDGLFDIDQATGELSLVSLPNTYESVSYILNVQVEDDGDPVETAQASITVLISASDDVYFINPNATGTGADGSFENPYHSWSEVDWQDGATYLQKRGTTAEEAKILVLASSVTLGDYGNGAKPVIISTATDYAIKVIDKHDILLKNLEVVAPDAVGAVYFLGASCENNSIENCKLSGADYGLRVIDGGSYTVKYCEFKNEVDGIYSISQSVEVYYSVFISHNVAINLGSYSSDALISNNVFYDNNQAVSSSYAEVELYNNIFYLTTPGAKAINHQMDKLVSDNNIFYPEQEGFIEIEGQQFEDLESYRTTHHLDLNSFSADPQFMDIYNENFAVKDQSRAIDAGRSVGISQDYYGQAVPLGNAPDIGLSEKLAQQVLFSEETELYGMDFEAYPNPSDGRFNLAFNNASNQVSDVYINTLDGRQVYFEQLTIEGNIVFEIDIRGNKPGMYILTIRSGDNLYTKRLIVQ